jgi:hypothetical protein
MQKTCEAIPLILIPPNNEKTQGQERAKKKIEQDRVIA